MSTSNRKSENEANQKWMFGENSKQKQKETKKEEIWKLKATEN